MVKQTTATNSSHLKALSRFLQILDGSFPSGVFVHSFGLEPHILKEKVKDIKSLESYLKNIIIDQYLKFEFVYIKKVYKVLEEKNLTLLKKVDNELCSFLTFEYAKASRDIGHNYYVQIKNLPNTEILKEYFSEIENKKSDANEIIVLSALAFDLGIYYKDFIVMWCKKNIINISATTLKISRIKPSEIQQMLFMFDEFLEELEFKKIETKVTNFNPLFEEVIFCHRNLEPKMFAT